MEDQKKVVNFLIFWVVTALTLLIFAAIFANNVVLGNDRVAQPMAAVFSGLVITIVIYLVPPILEKLQLKIKNEKVMVAVYFVTNVVAIWVIKRFAVISGFGVSSILWVLILAAVVTIVYWKAKILTAQIYKKYLKS